MTAAGGAILPEQAYLDVQNLHVFSSVASAGDINGGGFADVVIGASSADAPYPFARQRPGSGLAYVIYGRAANFGPNGLDMMRVLHPQINNAYSGVYRLDGFAIAGQQALDKAGYSVSSAGDMNGDGYDDMLIGAPNAASGHGAFYVVYGSGDGFQRVVDLALIAG